MFSTYDDVTNRVNDVIVNPRSLHVDSWDLHQIISWGSIFVKRPTKNTHESTCRLLGENLRSLHVDSWVFFVGLLTNIFCPGVYM